MTDDIEVRRRRLRYRAGHRGTRELDLMVGGYVGAVADGLDADGLARIEALLDQPDTDLMAWLTGQAAVPPDVDAALIGEIRRHAQARQHQQ